MNKEDNEKIINEIIEYANNEIKKSKKRHLAVLLSVLAIFVILCAALLFAFTFKVEGDVMLLLGIASIVSAIFNVIWTLRQKDAKWFRFISMAFTALTVCSFYSLAYQWVITKQADQLLDVMPTLSSVLWFLTIASITINGVSLFVKSDS